MKSTIFKTVLAICVTLSVACKAQSTSNKKNTSEKKVSPTASNVTPSFKNKEVQEYIDSYESYIKEYKKALENNDINTLSKLSQRGTEFGVKTKEVLTKVTDNDLRKLNLYMAKKVIEVREFSQRLAQR